ncbi:MAG: hypothetical protein LQ351_006156 [Letrouitia transgressa]|nr:MAG: hypothetical protein LQ351_006156 [Letrouitia transgressa]
MALWQGISSSIPTCFATVSIGTTQTPLEQKLQAISGAGFQGIELGFPDLLSFASAFHHAEISPQDYDALCVAGKQVKQMCQEANLKIVMLQPFANFEGWDRNSAERDDAFFRVAGWIRIMRAVGTDMLQVGSTDAINTTGSRNALATDLAELADLLAQHEFRLAYENWCWATHAPDWKDVWEIAQEVDRPNIGLCLDTFQTAGGEWADPTTSSGRIEREGATREDLDRQFQQSLEELTKTVPKEKIYILQISDAYKPQRPLGREPDATGLRPRGRWSMSLRPMPFDGGYLPVVNVATAVLRTGFRGWFSMEVFDGGPGGKDEEWKDLKGFARKAMNAHERLLRESGDH